MSQRDRFRAEEVISLIVMVNKDKAQNFQKGLSDSWISWCHSHPQALSLPKTVRRAGHNDTQPTGMDGLTVNTARKLCNRSMSFGNPELGQRTR